MINSLLFLFVVVTLAAAVIVAATNDHHHRFIYERTTQTCSLSSSTVITWSQSEDSITISNQHLSFYNVSSSSSPSSSIINLVNTKWDIFTASGNYKISNTIVGDKLGLVPSFLVPSSSSSAACTLGLVNGPFAYNITFTLKTNPETNIEYISYAIFAKNDNNNNRKYNSIELNGWGLPDSTSVILGMGEQYNTLDLRETNEYKKRTEKVIIFTREQGVGRGQQPFTDLVNSFSGEYAGGSIQTNYATRPLLQTHKGWMFQMLQPAGYSEWDFTSQAGKFSVLFNNTRVDSSSSLKNNNSDKNSSIVLVAAGNFAQCSSLKESTILSTRLVYEFYTLSIRTSSRKPPPPSFYRMPPPFSYSGAVIGMQGGTQAVLSNFTSLQQLGCPMSAFWLQDWTGPRQLTGRKGLWWSWGQWSTTHYPNVNEMISTLRGHNGAGGGIKTLLYVNPMIVNSSGAAGLANNPWQTAFEKGYFVTNKNNKNLPYTFYNGASIIDFTNPQAREWYVQLMMQSIQAANTATSDVTDSVSFGMTDFGEAIPIDVNDVNLFDKSVDPREYHNQYPDEWFSVVREAAERLSTSSSYSSYMNDTYFSFGRSAWLGSQFEYSAAWSGDQLCDFSNFDGLGSAVVSQLTSGLSGTIFQHSDIGGYNAELWYHRTEELFYRWCEFAAFTSFFRTHDGSNPEANFQFYRTETGRQNFVRYSKMFVAWLPLRRDLMNQAVRTGIPVSRPLLFEYYGTEENRIECPFPTSSSGSSSNSKFICNNFKQYIIGNRDLLVAPVLEKGQSTVEVYFPSDSLTTSSTMTWIHLITQQRFKPNSNDTQNQTMTMTTVSAKVGCPAVFVNSSSSYAFMLLDAFKEFRDQC